MKLREALIYQSPSLELQRAAADEIAELDARLVELDRLACKYQAKSWRDDNRISDLEDYLEAHNLTKEFEEWLAMNTEP